MTNSKTPSQVVTDDVWAQRRRSSVRLGWVLGAVAIGIFLTAILKYRPL